MSREVDTAEYMGMLRELIGQGHRVSVRVAGNSMSPFLKHGRDTVFFAAPDSEIKKGDIVFYTRPNGQYIMHRVLRRMPDGNYAIIGDGQQQVEAPIAPEQIFAVVTQVCRKGTWIGPKAFWWRFFAGPWLTLLPLRPLLRRMARFIPETLK